MRSSKKTQPTSVRKKERKKERKEERKKERLFLTFSMKTLLQNINTGHKYTIKE